MWHNSCFWTATLVLLERCCNVRMEVVAVTNPMSGSEEYGLTSCIQAVRDASHVDREMAILSKDGSKTINTIKITESSSSCVGINTDSFQFDLDTTGEDYRLRIKTTSESLRDAYLPVPLSCLGNEYIVSTWNPSSSGIAFAAIYNPNGNSIQINVSLGAELQMANVVADGVTLTPGSQDLLRIRSFKTVYVTSSTSALDGVVISGTETCVVLAGNLDTTVFGLGVPNHFIEMVPPTSFFQDQYMVPMPDHLLYAMTKIIATASGSTGVTTTVYAASPEVNSRTLAFAGDVWTVSHRFHLLVRSTKPVMVILFCPDVSSTSSSSMAIIAPISEWTSSTLTYPLVDASRSSLHAAQLIVSTSQANTLVATRLSDNADVTSSLSFNAIGQSGFSRCTVTFSEYVTIWLHSTSGAPFQVMQYFSGDGDDARAYSFRAGLHLTCLQATNSSTTYLSHPSSHESLEDLKLYSFSETSVYVTVAAFSLVLIIVMASLSLCLLARRRRRNEAMLMEKGGMGHRRRNVASISATGTFGLVLNQPTTAPRAHRIQVKTAPLT